MEPRLGLLLALADDELIMGHRMSEWTGWVPYIEEDLALSSLAQDEMAHARTLYEIASAMTEQTVDALALGREPTEYRHAVLCERPNRDYAYTLARHWLYDTADAVRLDALRDSSWKELAAALAVIQVEERYHLDHARTWFARIAGGPVEARSRLTAALQDAIGEAMSLFEPMPGEDQMLADGTMPRSNEAMLGTWLEQAGAELESVGLERVMEAGTEEPVGEMVPTSSGAIESSDGTGASSADGHTLRVPGLERRDGRWAHVGDFEGAGGRMGRHSPDFLPLWQEMTALYRDHPGATW